MTSKHFPHPSWIEIDLKQLKKNISLIKKHIGSSLFCLPIKANAYGHGLLEVGNTAEESKIDYLGVAHLQEGIKLRQNGTTLPILIFGAIHEDQILDLIHFNLEFTISSSFKANLVSQKCQKNNLQCKVHLEVDTGMQRTGVRPTTAPSLFQQLKSLPCFDIKGIYSHLATADQPNDPFALKQIKSFRALTDSLLPKNSPILRHIANSGGVAYFPEAYLDMVRPGLMTFGYLPKSSPKSFSDIAPCFSLKTKVSYSKIVEDGMGISYGHSHITSKRTRIITAPIGYGDGLRRDLSNKGSVLIRGKQFPIVGIICMDQFMVDVGDHDVRVGDEVVVIGKQGDLEITVEKIASLCNTTPYEILCFFNDRLPRFYLK